MKNKVLEISIDEEVATERKCTFLLGVFNFVAEIFFGKGFVVSQMKDEELEEE